MPTGADRVAQMVVKRSLEPEVDQHFPPDSSGYRPGKSAMEAVGQARERWWRFDWGLALDLKGFCDHSDHALRLRAVRQHTESPWGLWSIARWLQAPGQRPDGTLVEREKGTPQGGVGRPRLAHLCWHYTFDVWRQRPQPDIPCERYAEEAVCHGRSEEQAQRRREEREQRCAACRLARHPQQTQMVSCQDEDRRGHSPHEHVDFLG